MQRGRLFGRGDKITLAELSMIGRIVRVPEQLFFNREHSGRSVNIDESQSARGRTYAGRRLGTGPRSASEWFDWTLADRIMFPDWRVFREYARSIGHVPPSPSKCLRCYGHLASLYVRFAPTALLRDVLIAGAQGVRRALPRRTNLESL